MRKTLFFVLFALALCVMSLTAFGASFGQDELYTMKQPLSEFPATIEAVIKYPENFAADSRGGVITGSYDGTNSCINFEIYTGGAVRLYVMDGTNPAYNVVFKDTNVYTGGKVHIAVVNDSENGKVYCYIDGELAQTVEKTIPENITFTQPMVLGGDNREGNAMSCKGEILSLAMYSDIRTDDEIASDCSSDEVDTDGIIAYYDIPEGNKPSVFKDLSGNGYDFKGYSAWLEETDELEEYAYSFALVGDTQIVNRYSPQYMTNIYDYLVDNAHENKLKFVMGLGDITDTNTDAEWALAKAVMQKLNGVVPYSVVRGNHDSIANFNKYFTKSEYESRLGGTYDSSMVNSYQFVTVCGIKYLIFTLDYGANDDVLEWAGQMIEENYDCNVIITTHAYLYRDGTTLDEGDVCPPSTSGGTNNGDDLWDKLISKYENIVLVISGHDPCDYVVLAQDEGDNGNVVSQLLVDPQGTDKAIGATGMVAMLYFSEDGRNVQVRYYSTVKNMYYRTENQFSFELEVIEAEDYVTSAPSMEISGISFNVNLEADELEGQVVAALYDDYGTLVSVKIYDGEETVNVSFPKNVSGSVAKVFWWNGIDTLIPICVNEKLGIMD